MISEERRQYLLNRNKMLIDKLNELIGDGSNKKMSQRELANILGCSNSTVSRWLKLESSLSIEYASRICDILGLDKNEYLNYKDLFEEKLLSNDKFVKLTDENKNKVFEYINYLLFLQDKEEQDIKDNSKMLLTK